VALVKGVAVHGGHFFLFGFVAFFVAILLNSLLKNWLNVNLSQMVGGAS
jgi:hypothetical protein